MTAYHGGKQRIGEKIAQIIFKTAEKISLKRHIKIKGYCEPFCGMLGVFHHIPKLFKRQIKYHAGDINKSVILMWRKAQKGWRPPTTKITRHEFDRLKYNNKYSALKGFVGHVYTYRGVFFDGYFPHTQSKIKHNSDNVVKIAKKLKQVHFTDGNYEQFSKLKNYILYCDPPYQGTEKRYYSGKQYKNKLQFNHIKFWQWCKKMAKTNIVFVSEYKKPRDKMFKKIWSQGDEKLFLVQI
jgi:site-specific DNA-adenine methylase